jgi:SAM-dependent methyltransferase
MYTETAHLYDRIYQTWKDYRREALDLAHLIQFRRPQTQAILDVACGTGEHARTWIEDLSYRVDGIDLQESFLKIAREKCPRGNFVQADMRDFDLKGKYDVVLCLFSAIGYVKTTSGLNSAIRCMASHLLPGGLLLIDPWFPPGILQEGRVSVNTVDTQDGKIVRMSHTHLQGLLSVITFAYLVGDPQGVRQYIERHELGVFSREDFTEVFRKNGLSVEFDPKGPSGRGLYIAVKAGAGGGA